MADQDELRERRDADGIALPDALAEHGVDLDRAMDARSQLEHAAAYLELHIEQGPVLESMDLPLGVVLGTFGVERHLDHLARAGGARRLDADGRAGATRLPARRSSRSRSARSPSGRAAGPSARRAASSASPASSRRWSRPRSSYSTSATSTPMRSRRCWPTPRRAQSASQWRSRSSLVRQDLVDRADPLPPGADRALRRGDPRGDADLAPAAVRARCTTRPRCRAPACRR